MTADKIDLMAQPDTTDGSQATVRETTVNKLQALVNKDLEAKDGSESDSDDYDTDGFKIPSGKIPLDGQFSTLEMKELVEMSKQEGLIKDEVDVKEGESNLICNHLEIVEPKSEA